MTSPRLRSAFVAALFSAVTILACQPAWAATSATLTVTVVEVQSAVPIPNATVTLEGRDDIAHSVGQGTYRFDTVAPGDYHVEAGASGYQSAEVVVHVGTDGATVSIPLRRGNDATQLPQIATIQAVAQDRPDSGMTVHTTLGGQSLVQAGAFRLADALVEVPALNATDSGRTTQANGPGSSIYMDARGLGVDETLSMIDGHPIAQGIDLGYNYQNAPIFGLQDVYIGYGTGASGLSSYGVAGGIVDMRTLEPSLTPHVRYLQGLGSFGLATSAFNATGTTAHGKIGYAFAYGVEGSGGPLGTQRIYAPSASWDASSPAYRDDASFRLSQATIRRSFLAKLRFTLGTGTFLTLHAMSNDSTADGTGNSDNIYLTPTVALAKGQQLLTNKGVGDPCGPGTFMAVNAFGIPNGVGRDFAPDGGVTCQTPQQYAQFNIGWQGYGPHHVTNTLSDYDLRVDTGVRTQRLTLDTFSNSYKFYYDRSQFLPYFASPGDTGFVLDQTVTNTGFTLSDRIDAGPHQIGLLYRYLNSGSSFAATGSPLQAPSAYERTAAVQDTWSAPHTPLVARLQLAATASSATHSSFLNPHADVQYALGNGDRVRISGGSSAVQPPAAWLGLPFVPLPLPQFTGALDCAGTNAIGSAPSTALKPERAYDTDMAYTHDWSHDDYTTVDLYTENLFDKIYNTTVPLSALPAGTISPSVLAGYQNALQTTCGAATAATLGLTGYVNVGRVQARGIMVVGEQHVARNLSLAYGWSEESAILRSANIGLLQNNPTMILNGQLPSVPIGKASLALRYHSAYGMEAMLSEYLISANNPANLPAYNYTNAEIGIPTGHSAIVRLNIDNVFNQWSSSQALIGEGYTLPLNGYALPGANAPFVGAGATVLQNLAPRRFEITFQIGGSRR